MGKLLGWQGGVLLALVFVVLQGLALKKAHDLGDERATARANAEKLVTSQRTVRLLENANLTTTKIEDSAEAQRKVTHEKLAQLRTDLAAANQRLLDRPGRPAGGADLSPTASAGPALGRTGAELYREDGLFLNGEAARAEAGRLLLAECQTRYAAARAVINNWVPRDLLSGP